MRQLAHSVLMAVSLCTGSVLGVCATAWLHDPDCMACESANDLWLSRVRVIYGTVTGPKVDQTVGLGNGQIAWFVPTDPRELRRGIAGTVGAR